MRTLLPRSVNRQAALLAVSLAWPCAAPALETTEWKHRQLLPIAQPGLVSVALPNETLDAARSDLGDLRLVGPAGQEVAYVVRRASAPAPQMIRARSFRSTLEPSTTQLVIETSEAAASVVILETPATDFVKSARLETSDDGLTWQTEETGTPIFRQRRAEQLRLAVRGRFLRITLDDARTPPVPFTGAQVVLVPDHEGTVQPVPARITRREEFAGETVLTVALAAAHVPLQSLVIRSPERLFTRRVSVAVREQRDELALERTMATGTIYEVALDERGRSANATIPLEFTAPSRELSLHVVNDDSPPLALDAVEVSRYVVTLYFDATARGDYALLSGHPHVPAPRYDLSGIQVEKTSRVTPIVPAALAENPGYRAPEALAGTALLGAALDPAAWGYRKAVRLAAPGVQQLELDLDVLVHARRDFADLRLLRDGRQVPYLLDRSALTRPLELTANPLPDPKRPQVSRWEIKLPQADLPVTRLTLNSPTALFRRQLRIFETIPNPHGNAYEHTLGSAEWSRTPGDRRALTLALQGTPSTDVLVLETDNGDNPPLALERVSATYPVVRLLFKSEEPGVLYYGNRSVTAPRYDLTLVAGQILAAEKNIASLGPEEKAKQDGWAATALRGTGSGILFWGVLAGVVLALLAVVAKLLPKPQRDAR